MAREDDPSIAGNVLLYRRIPPKPDNVKWREEPPRPSSSNFKDRMQELSMHIASETTPDLTLAGHDQFGLVEITAGEIREICGDAVKIYRDDIDTANGHVLIVGKVSNGNATLIAKKARWVEGRLPTKPG